MSVVKKDSVFAFLRNAGGAIAGIIALATAAWWGFGPRLELEARDWINEQIGVSAESIGNLNSAVSENTETVLQLTQTVRSLSDEVATIQEERLASSEPPIEWAGRGHSATDGVIGGYIETVFYFRKLRDCGRPRVGAFFRNGGGVVHRFEDRSTLDAEGYGVTFPISADFQPVTASVRIPENDGVHIGRAFAYLVIDYPEKCPNVEPILSPEALFFIRPNDP